MDVIIRRGEKKDVPSWVRMILDLRPDETLEAHEALLLEFLPLKEFRGWLAFDNEEAVGFAEAYLRPFANGCEGRPVVFLEGIWVRESHRRQGLGKRLLAEVENWAKELGLKEVGSDIYFGNTISKRAHLNWGFEEKEKVIYFRKAI